MSDTTHARGAQKQERQRKSTVSRACPKASDLGDSLGVAFVRNLRQARVCAGIKCYAAADMLGVSKATWSHWESGKRLPSLTMLDALARCLNVHPCMLLRKKGSACFTDSKFTLCKPCGVGKCTGVTL